MYYAARLSFLFSLRAGVLEYASAASHTHAPSSHAFLRVSSLSLLQRPFALSPHPKTHSSQYPLYYENRDEVIKLIHFIKENTDKNVYPMDGDYLKEEVEKWIDTSTYRLPYRWKI